MRFSIDFIRAFLVLLGRSAPIWIGISILITILGLVIARLEGFSIGDGLYFVWVTGTTVGYGDLAPTIGVTRFLAIVVAILGILFTGIMVALAIEAAKVTIQIHGSLDDMKRSAESAAQKRTVKSKERSQE